MHRLLILSSLFVVAFSTPKLFYYNCDTNVEVDFTDKTTPTITYTRPSNIIVYCTNDNIFSLSNEEWRAAGVSFKTTSTFYTSKQNLSYFRKTLCTSDRQETLPSGEYSFYYSWFLGSATATGKLVTSPETCLTTLTRAHGAAKIAVKLKYGSTIVDRLAEWLNFSVDQFPLTTTSYSYSGVTISDCRIKSVDYTFNGVTVSSSFSPTVGSLSEQSSSLTTNSRNFVAKTTFKNEQSFTRSFYYTVILKAKNPEVPTYTRFLYSHDFNTCYTNYSVSNCNIGCTSSLNPTTRAYNVITTLKLTGKLTCSLTNTLQSDNSASITKDIYFCPSIPSIGLPVFDQTLLTLKIPTTESFASNAKAYSNCPYKYLIKPQLISGFYSSIPENGVNLKGIADGSYTVEILISLENSNIPSQSKTFSFNKCVKVPPTFNASIDMVVVSVHSGISVNFSEVKYGKDCWADGSPNKNTKNIEYSVTNGSSFITGNFLPPSAEEFARDLTSASSLLSISEGTVSDHTATITITTGTESIGSKSVNFKICKPKEPSFTLTSSYVNVNNFKLTLPTDFHTFFGQQCDKSTKEFEISFSSNFNSITTEKIVITDTLYKREFTIPQEVYNFVGYTGSIKISIFMDNGYRSTTTELSVQISNPGSNEIYKILLKEPSNYICKTSISKFTWSVSKGTEIISLKLYYSLYNNESWGSPEESVFTGTINSEIDLSINKDVSVPGIYKWWLVGTTNGNELKTVAYRFVVADSCSVTTDSTFAFIKNMDYEKKANNKILLHWIFDFPLSDNRFEKGIVRPANIVVKLKNVATATESSSTIGYSDMTDSYFLETSIGSTTDYVWAVCYQSLCKEVDIIVCPELSTPSLGTAVVGVPTVFSWTNSYKFCGGATQELVVTSSELKGEKKFTVSIPDQGSTSSYTYSYDFSNDFLDPSKAFKFQLEWAVSLIVGSRKTQSSSQKFSPCIAIKPSAPALRELSMMIDTISLKIIMHESYVNLCKSYEWYYTVVLKRGAAVLKTGTVPISTKPEQNNYPELTYSLTKSETALLKRGNVDVDVTMSIKNSGTVFKSDAVSGSFRLCINQAPTVKAVSKFPSNLVYFGDSDYNVQLQWELGEQETCSGTCEQIVTIRDSSKVVKQIKISCDDEFTSTALKAGVYTWNVVASWDTFKEEFGTIETFVVCEYKKMTTPNIKDSQNYIIPASGKVFHPPFQVTCESDCKVKSCDHACEYDLFLNNQHHYYSDNGVFSINSLDDGDSSFSCTVRNGLFDDYPSISKSFKVCNLIAPDKPKISNANILNPEEYNERIYFIKNIENLPNFTFTAKASSVSWGSKCYSSKITYHLDDYTNPNAIIPLETDSDENGISFKIELTETGRYEFRLFAENGDGQKSSSLIFFVVGCSSPLPVNLDFPADGATGMETVLDFKWGKHNSFTAGYPCIADQISGRYLFLYVVPESETSLVDTSGSDTSGSDSDDSERVVKEIQMIFNNEEKYRHRTHHLAGTLTPPRLAINSVYYWRVDTFNGQEYVPSAIRSFTTKGSDCATILCNTNNAECSEITGGAQCDCFSGYSGVGCESKNLNVAAAVAIPVVLFVIIIVFLVIVLYFWRKNRQTRLKKPDLLSLRFLPVVVEKRVDNIHATVQYLEKDPGFAFSKTRELIKNSGSNEQLLLALFYAFAKTGHDIDFLTALLFQDILTLPDKPFHNTSDGTKVYSYFCRLYGLDYMWDNYHKLMNEFHRKKKKLLVSVKGIESSSISMTTNVTSQSTASYGETSFSSGLELDTDDDIDNQGLFMMISASKMQKCLTSSTRPPPEFLSLFSCLKTEIIDANVEINVAVPLLILFIRKFVMGVVATGHLSVYPQIDDAIKKQLIILEKLYSRTILGISFEEHVKPRILFSCNPFIDQNSDNLHSFMLTLCSEGETLDVRGKPSQLISDALYNDCIQIIHEHFSGSALNTSFNSSTSFSSK